MSVASSRMEDLGMVTHYKFIIGIVAPASRRLSGRASSPAARRQISTGCPTLAAFARTGDFQTLSRPYSAQHRTSLAKPGTLPPPQISRHSRLLRQNHLRPLARLRRSSLRLQKQGVMIVGL